MAAITKQWTSGTGSVTIEYGGQGNGSIVITSDANNLYEARSMDVIVRTTDGSKQVTLGISQAERQKIDLSAAVVTASNQTYSGSAKTPTPKVMLNGDIVPSTGYTVSYSNNINAGTATITITGKGEYTGTATGTFTISKASRTLSFSSSYAVVVPSGTVTRTATPSAGSGDGSISYSSSNTSRATVNSSGKVTANTSEGTVTITATIAEGTNYLSASASYTVYVFATTHNYSYTGSAQYVTLPPGTYNLQVWGAQGGSNAAASSYGITAQAGGKGGYSEGQLTISTAKDIEVEVGGQGSSSAGGFNGGGGTSGSSQYNGNNIFGITKMGGGGGGTDIRLKNGGLLSRMIVAGGGSGANMCYKQVTNVDTHIINNSDIDTSTQLFPLNGTWTATTYYKGDIIDISDYQGYNLKITRNGFVAVDFYENKPVLGEPEGTRLLQITEPSGTRKLTGTVPSNARWMWVCTLYGGNTVTPQSIEFSQTSTTTNTFSNIGYYGGGRWGGAYYTNLDGGIERAGTNASFGQGANQSITNYRFCSAGGGGGWYGGGGGFYDDDDMTILRYIGGGSGWINISSNASHRPSGYTGLELDSGTTYSGNTSFPAPGGGTETGHSGNGYARITRIS